MHHQVKQMLESFMKQPKFSDSKLLKILLYNSEALNMSDREKFFDALLLFYQNFISESTSENAYINEIKENIQAVKSWGEDFRIKSIRVSNFRGVPQQFNEVPYGIDFCTADKPQSIIILGSNGTGKSSIYSGIEFIYTDKISEKILRTDKDASMQDFMEYYKRDIEKSLFEICSVDQILTLEKPLMKVNAVNGDYAENYFISENDLITIGKLNFQDDKNGPNSFTAFVARSVGFSKMVEYYDFIAMLNKYKRMKERNEYSNLLRQEELLVSHFNEIQAEIEEKNILLKTFDNEDQSFFKQNELINFVKSLRLSKLTIPRDKERLPLARNKFLDVYLKFLNTDKAETSKLRLDFLRIGLELLHQSENCPLCGDSKKDKTKIEEEVLKSIDETRNQIELIESLENAKEEILDIWKRFDLDLIKLEEELHSETSAILGYDNLFGLLEKEKVISEMISQQLLRTEYWGRIRKIIGDSATYGQDDEIFKILSSENENIVLSLIKRIEDFDAERGDILDDALSGVSGGEVISKKLDLEEKIESLSKRLELKVKERNEIKENIKTVSLKINLVDALKKEIQILENEMSKYIQEITDGPFKLIEEIVLEVMNDYLSLPYSNVELKIDKKLGRKGRGDEEVEFFYYVPYLILKNGDEIQKIAPDKYLNSFRYKLFCLMLKIAITISYRVQNKQNYPLIIDDIFYVSDYENRNNFSSFVRKIFELFEKYTQDLPLQLIIFTHDSLIFRSSMDAIYRMGQPYISTTKFAKLFAPEDRDSAPSFDNSNNRFWNLVRFVNEIFVTKAGSR